ncbi:MAG: hypothetical protein DM484_08405 [Candidatus Methylumidiphilus alinenensis]|uniref:FimV N-terminal domain-containing protein n=1 Tax=Candidatus Methylumidiphilus alinenensis TaxID=2202197 RepID=A0A2W4RID0_9GAMM|nr:MAG: hypothetical protein DM484_08405 [Candidatus Methylumidiphilus alinenensis]
MMSLFAPWGAHALGIGDIIVHSALDESLNAEIPLVTSNDEDVSDIRVTLASPEAFARAHIERSYSLTKLSFTTRKKPDGRLSIFVTSKNAIREPIMDFIVEVYWPQGRQLREFTALLDPPGSSSMQQASEDDEEPPKTANVSPDEDRPEQRHAFEEPVRSRPRRSIRNDGRGNNLESGGPITGTQYGPVERNETLSNIAQKFQQPNISQRQLIHALYKGNPKAFYKDSIDALKAGATITIPDQASIMRLAGLDGVTQEPENTGRLNSKSKTVAGPLAAETNAEQETHGQLKLLSPSASKSPTTATASLKQLKTDKAKEDLARELADTFKQESEIFRKRLTDLEQKMSAMEKLLALKDGQIASLQTRLAHPNKEEERPVPIASISPSKTAPSAEAEQVNTPPDVQNQEISQAASLTPAARPTIPATPKPVGSVTPKPMPRRPVQIEPLKSNVTANEEGFLAELNQPYYWVAIATVLLLLGLLFQFIRRRSAMTEDTESILTLTEKEKSPHQPLPAPETVDTSQNVTQQPTVFRSSFLSEFTPSDFDALSGDITEVDPVSEADVYLAYGRYKQAEELIIGAIEKNPERDDCRLKLFEIHYATENATAFEECAELLAPTHKNAKPEFWEKVVEMGRELCPRSPLFNQNLKSTAHAASYETSAQPKPVVDNQQNLYHFDQDDVLEHLDHPTAPPIAGKTNQGKPEDVRPSISYDFFSTEDKVNIEEKSTEEPKDKPEQPDLKNTISFEKTETYPIEEEIEIPDESMEEMLAKLTALSDDKYSPQSKVKGQIEQIPLETKPTVGQMELEIQDNALEFEKDIPNTGDFEFDDIRTKLDLANAYYDLGDQGAARAILLTVVQIGNDQQKEEANSLLNKLDGKG